MQNFCVHPPREVMNAAILQAGYIGNELADKATTVIGIMTDDQYEPWIKAYPDIPFSVISTPRSYKKGTLNTVVFNRFQMKDMGFRFEGYYRGPIGVTKEWVPLTNFPLKT